MKAKVENDWVSVVAASVCEGVHFAMVACADYEAYCALPQVISFEGRLLGRTGWNSDKGVAYFRSDAKMGRVIPKQTF